MTLLFNTFYHFTVLAVSWDHKWAGGCGWSAVCLGWLKIPIVLRYRWRWSRVCCFCQGPGGRVCWIEGKKLEFEIIGHTASHSVSTPSDCSLSVTSPWSRQSNALLKSSSILVVRHPSSSLSMMVSVSCTIAVVVDLPSKKPCCLWVSRLCWVRCSRSLGSTTRSRILEKVEIKEIGR